MGLQKFSEDKVLGTLTGLFRAHGYDGTSAQDAVAAIEGGLVIARVSGSTGPFIRAIESLPERFMLLRREDSK
jgi:hypothetical protein